MTSQEPITDNTEYWNSLAEGTPFDGFGDVLKDIPPPNTTQDEKQKLRKALQKYNWSSDKDYQLAVIAFNELFPAHYAQQLVEAKKLQDAITRATESLVNSGISPFDPVIARAVDSLKITFADGQLAALAPQEKTTGRV